MNQDLEQTPTTPQVKVLRPKAALREAVEDVFYNMGGPDAMLKWVQESTVNRRIFYKDILPKLIPREVRGEIGGKDGGPMKMVIEWAQGDVRPAIEATTGAIADTIAGVIAATNDED